jgi:acetyl esterase/lipase
LVSCPVKARYDRPIIMNPARFLALVLAGLFAEQIGRLDAAEKPGLTSIQRLELDHLKATRAARLRLAEQRKPVPNLGVYEDFRAILHVHAEDSNHTKGTRPEVLAAAKKTGVQIVMFTDHGGPKPETWKGIREGVLFFPGEENGGAGLIRFPAFDEKATNAADNELRFLSHIEERYTASSEGFAGMEICNRHSDAKLDNLLQLYVAGALGNPEKWNALVAAFRQYPDEFFGAGSDYRAEIMAKWDAETKTKRFVGIGANDAHQNQIFNGVTFDPYEVSFRNLSTHILARELSEPEIRQSLREGRAYVAHDWLCDPTGFMFGAANNLGVFTMGDSVPILGRTRVVGVTPVAARLKLFRNGVVVQETEGTNLTFNATEPGAYRLEAWLAIDQEERPWIYANPVFLRAPGLAELTLPSEQLAPAVVARRNLSYVSGDPADTNKHQLDVYYVPDRPPAPVFFFVHGGAWRSGDRAQYPAVANRFAKDGIVTVVPSYRLAPKHPHPAQAEDVAAAFAWVVQHIGEYGGDPNHLYLGGHSAGGHLVALLALNEKLLVARGVPRSKIRGVIALSGVYDLTVGESLASVFGSDDALRRDASPRHHVRKPAPPFLITYCQWDYLTLPAQARLFAAALRREGISAELAYVPGESHISEMVHMPRDGNFLADKILEFIKTQHSKPQPESVSRAE